MIPRKISFRRKLRAMTIIEVVIAGAVLLVILASVLSALVFAHRTAQESIDQNSAYSNVRATMEQLLRGVSFSSLPYTDSSNNLYLGDGSSLSTASAARNIPVIFNGNVSTNLSVSVGSLPDLTSLSPGMSIPSGTVETSVSIDLNNTGANTDDDVNLKLWLWVQDASQAGVEATQVRAITIIYQWRFKDGNNVRWHIGVMRDIRSAAPTF